MSVDTSEIATDEILERPARDPQHVTEVDDGETRPTVGFPPLSCHGVGLRPADPQQGAGFLHRQEQWERVRKHKLQPLPSLLTETTVPECQRISTTSLKLCTLR